MIWVSRILFGLIGLTFAWAGVSKLWDPSSFLSAILTYDVLGYRMAVIASLWIPYLELCVGCCLVTGYMKRGATVLAAGLVIIFLVFLVQGAIRGLDVNCGCFGTEAHSDETGYLWPISRDILLLFGLGIGVASERIAKEGAKS